MIKKVLLTLSILVSIIGGLNFYKSYKSPSYAQSFGSLTVNFHSSLPGNAVFDIHNFLPGDSATKTIDVKNDGKNTTEVKVRGIKTDGSPDDPKIEDVLDLTIKNGANTLYSNKLANFLGVNEVSLGTLNKNQTKSYEFKVSFPTSSGNEYQNKFVKFNLVFKGEGDVKGDHDEKDHHDNRDDDKHPDRGNDDKGHNYWNDVKDFGDKCKSTFQKFFKFGKR